MSSIPCFRLRSRGHQVIESTCTPEYFDVDVTITVIVYVAPIRHFNLKVNVIDYISSMQILRSGSKEERMKVTISITNVNPNSTLCDVFGLDAKAAALAPTGRSS